MAKKLLDLENFYNLCTIADNQLNTEILYTKTKTKILSWQGHLICTPDDEGNEISKFKTLPISFSSKDNGVFYTTYRLTENGKLNYSAPTLVKTGTNKGRKNETTPFQQALSKLMTKYNDKVKEGAVNDKNKLLIEISYNTIINRDIPFPNRVNVMALHNVKDHWAKVKYPCYAQPKLDGIHMVANCWHKEKECVLDLYSRGLSKKISQNHIREALGFLCGEEYRGIYVTGEIWGEKINRQNIASIVGQEDDENVKIRLSLHVFDVFSVDKKMPYSERYELAKKIVKKADSPYIVLVEAILINSREELDEYYKQQIQLGMEGVVVRSSTAFYEFGVQKEIRSHGVMKYKPRQDSEFLITGYKAGTGKFSKSIIFIAKTENGEVFSVSPAWPQEDREKALLEGDSYVGKMATISYDTISDKGVPVQPVLIAFV